MSARLVEEDRIHPNVIANTFKKADFFACLKELIKNSADADATSIRITTANRQVFRLVDNGNGMNEAGRRAYLHAGYSTGDGSTSAKFGTGARMFPFSFASRVKVSTVSVNDPGVVYQCEFTPEELLQYYFHRHDIVWTRVSKTRASWGHPHPTGVDVTYTLRDPKRRGILRGATLRQRLTDHFDIGLVESDMFLVDGTRLPPKQYADNTRPISFTFDNSDLPGMGPVRFEFYRPKKPRTGDLLMTGRTIGEVSFRTRFVRILPESIAAAVPETYLQSEVCGLIAADFLNDYATHQRDEYQGAEDDERTLQLLRLLESVQSEVADALGIKLRQQDEGDAVGRKQVMALLENLNNQYNQGDPPPLSPDGEEATGEPTDTDITRKRRSVYFRLNQAEFEPGEAIKATLVTRLGSPGEYTISHSGDHAKLVRKDAGTVELQALSVGQGRLTARHRKTGATTRVTYTIVAQRWLRLEVEPEATIGQRVFARVVNIDKAPNSAVQWRLLDGPGKLLVNPGGQSAVFVSQRMGITSLEVCAKEDPTIRDERDIQVVPSDQDAQRAICIRGEFFIPRFDGVMGQVRHSKPVTITKNAGSLPHRLTFTPEEPGYAKAYQTGELPLYLIPFIAREFADIFYEGNGDAEITQWEVARLAAEVAAEMYGAKPVED